MAVKAHAMISRLLTLHLYRCLVSTWVSGTIVPHLYTYVRMMSVAQTIDSSCIASDKQQLTRALEYKQNHNTLNNKLLFKYTRLSLVLADILNVSFSPSYGLEIIIPLSLKWLTKRETYTIYRGATLSLNVVPRQEWCAKWRLEPGATSSLKKLHLQGQKKRKHDSGRAHPQPSEETSWLLTAVSRWPWPAEPRALVHVSDFQWSPKGIQRLDCRHLLIFWKWWKYN